jgi:hypothetical protein
MSDPSRSSRDPDRLRGKTSLPVASFGLDPGNVQLRFSIDVSCIDGNGRCPVDLGHDSRSARYDVAGGHFPVGLSSVR